MPLTLWARPVSVHEILYVKMRTIVSASEMVLGNITTPTIMLTERSTEVEVFGSSRVITDTREVA